MVFGFKESKKRFTLYHLEENEIYTQDCQVHCMFLDNNN
jgi:hypothetical protein